MLQALLRGAKNAIAPKGATYRRIAFGPAAGCTMLIDFQKDASLWAGLYEIEVEPHLRALLRPAMNCFDVGGAGGYDALIMAKRTSGRVLSFECSPREAQTMRATFARNPYPIAVVEAFVGHGDGQLTLDAAAAAYFTPEFIKIDIEGAEADALRGAERILSGCKPSLLVETHGKDTEEQCLEILARHAYSVEIVNQRSWLKERRPLPHNRWLVARPRR